jgi:hypothetical protein
MGDLRESVGISFNPPEGVSRFAVQKRVLVLNQETKQHEEKWKTQFFQSPEAPGVSQQYVPLGPDAFADVPGFLHGIRTLWGTGHYRLRWVRPGPKAEGGGSAGYSSAFEVTDPRTADAPPEAFGGRAPTAPPGFGGGPAIDASTGRPVVATPADAMALLPPDVQKFVAMQSVMRTLTQADVTAQAEAQRQHFELMLRMVDRNAAHQAPAAGLDARDLKLALLETVAPLHQEIRSLKGKIAELEGGAGDDEDEIDWDEPLGTILGKEVKKGIVEVAGEITPEVVPFLKEAIPSMFAHLKAKMQEEKAKALAKAAGTNGAVQ